MTRLAISTQCPKCETKWAMKGGWYRHQNSQTYLHVCDRCYWSTTLNQYIKPEVKP
jgi:hypothetical protein